MSVLYKDKETGQVLECKCDWNYSCSVGEDDSMIHCSCYPYTCCHCGLDNEAAQSCPVDHLGYTNYEKIDFASLNQSQKIDFASLNQSQKTETENNDSDKINTK